MRTLGILWILLAGAVSPVAGGHYGYYAPLRQYYPSCCQQPYHAPAKQDVKHETKYETHNDQHNVAYHYNISYSQPATAQGNTVYGYTEVSEVYPDVDLGAKLDQALRLGDRIIGASEKVTGDVLGLIHAEGAQRARVAELLAKRDGLVAMNETLKTIGSSGASSVYKSSSYGEVRATHGGGGGAGPVPDVGAPAPDKARSNALIEGVYQKCQACHSDATAVEAGGGAVLPRFEELTGEDRKLVRLRLSTHDTEKRMPKGSYLSDEELQAVLGLLGDK